MDKEDNEKEKLIELRFIDSFKFMASSLDSLTRNLVGSAPCDGKGGGKLFGFKNYSELQYELLTRKGVYPYEYMSWDKYKESLPPIEAFYSKLNVSKISEDDYQHAQRVWKEFRIHNLGDYHDLYLRTNMVLLANVFEAFRDTCLEHYSLDPTHFYMAPGLAWKACLKKTRVRLELLTDPDMLLRFERGIRGGITQAVDHYALANNKYMMGDLYNLNKESSYLQYLDANNLYGWAMCQLLPTSKFKWVNIKPSQISTLAASKIKGYLLEVNVRSPTELYDSHNDLSFMSKKMKINKVEKLVPNLRDKKNYIIHIRALDQALTHGLVLERIHKAIEFNQSDWMKPYIDFNTQLRTLATNDFEKDFFKLMNNSIFGKMMENIRKHRNIKLVTNKAQYLKTVLKPNFKSGVLFCGILKGCKMGKIKVVMKKPVCLSQAILDLSKIVMYEFHNDYMKPKFKDPQLCYMDTDSLIYNIKTEDFYADIAEDVLARFDTSGYIPDRPLPIGLNKKVIGLMKDELGEAIMTEFVALRPKLYSYKVQDGTENMKCKGIKRVCSKTLMFEDYKNCFFNDSTEYRSQLMFQSIKHDIFTIEVNKVALNRYDDKRISGRNGISTFTRGYQGQLSLI